MKEWKKYLPVALFLVFLFLSITAFFQSRPTSKNARLYPLIQHYSPYYLDKRFGGLTIRKKGDEDFKEKPTNKEIFRQFEHLEKDWGQSHLKVQNNLVLILDNNGTPYAKLPLESLEEKQFIYDYYGVK